MVKEKSVPIDLRNLRFQYVSKTYPVYLLMTSYNVYFINLFLTPFKLNLPDVFLMKIQTKSIFTFCSKLYISNSTSFDDIKLTI